MPDVASSVLSALVLKTVYSLHATKASTAGFTAEENSSVVMLTVLESMGFPCLRYGFDRAT